MTNSIFETISNEFAAAAEKVGSSVVAVHARRWMPVSGIQWKKGVIVTVHHGSSKRLPQREFDILPRSGRTRPADTERPTPLTRLRSSL
jgi:hypothetical protein